MISIDDIKGGYQISLNYNVDYGIKYIETRYSKFTGFRVKWYHWLFPPYGLALTLQNMMFGLTGLLGREREEEYDRLPSYIFSLSILPLHEFYSEIKTCNPALVTCSKDEPIPEDVALEKQIYRNPSFLIQLRDDGNLKYVKQVIEIHSDELSEYKEIRYVLNVEKVVHDLLKKAEKIGIKKEEIMEILQKFLKSLNKEIDFENC